MPSYSTHRDLIAWREAMHLVAMVYRETGSFPKEETFGLTNQIRRAAVSIPSNIAEGAGRSSPAELARFVGIACGSLAELETQLQIAVTLGFLQRNAESLQQAARVAIFVRRLRKSLVQRLQQG